MNLVAQRGQEILGRLPQRQVMGVEVGVWDGRLSRYLLSRNPNLSLLMVDRWHSVTCRHSYWKSNSQMARSTQDTFDYFLQQCKKIEEAYEPRAMVIQAESVDAADMVPDSSQDFVFIDAEHTYEAVKEDMAAWSTKLVPGGVLGGHDWEHPDHLDDWGVRRAVEEFVETRSHNGNGSSMKIELGRNRTWFLRC